MARGTPRAASVARLLDQRRRAAGRPPPIGPLRLRVPADLDHHIRNHDPGEHDALADDTDDTP